MANVRLIAPNLIDTATLRLSSGSSATNLGVGNLKIYNNSRVLRVTGNNGTIAGNLAASSKVSGFVVWRHTLATSGTYRLRLYPNNNQGGTAVYDSTTESVPSKANVDDLGRNVLAIWFDEVTARSFSLQITNGAAFDITRLYMGSYLSPKINANYGLSVGWQESTTQSRTQGSSIRSVGAVPYRRMAFTMSYIDEDERPAWMKLAADAGLRKDIFVSAFPESSGNKEADYSFAGKFVDSSNLAHNIYNHYMVPMVIEEG